MKHLIVSVDDGSIAQELGVAPGWFLCAINGEPVCDVIDYEHLCANELLTLSLIADSGEEVEAEVEKELYEPLGLCFESGLMSPIRSCKNRCVFCFIDQMPKGIRKTLHVKDDDWRLSLIMGNYVSITNIDDGEFERIIRRRASPLYISVHATNGMVRKRMMNNPHADNIMDRLRRLKKEGMEFCAQIVLCPGLNDGQVLKESLQDLSALRPAALSVAVVPVGLTKYREGLFPLRPLTSAEAQDAIDIIEDCNRECGQTLVFASDELYILAGRELPPYSYYQDFTQLENGVGLLRKFEHEFMEALGGRKPLARPVEYDSACGVSAAPFLQTLFSRLAEYNIVIHVHPVKNEYFGHTVTVSGLLCPGDLIQALRNDIISDTLLITRNMMRENDTVFLDGNTLEHLETALHKRVVPMPPSDGEEFIEALFTLEKGEI